MKIFDSSFGIDFRKNHLILTYLKGSFGKIRLAGMERHALLPESQKEEREVQIVGLINAFVARHQIHKERVSVSLPREKVILRFIRFPLATRENLRKVLEYETSRYTPFEKGETYFDYQILKEGKEGLHILAAFIRKPEVDSLLSLLKKIGIQPRSIQIPPVAALNLFHYHEGTRDGAPTVLVDISESFVEINLLLEKIWVQNIHFPLPAEEKASALVTTLKRAGLQGEALSKAVFRVYGSEADETFLSSLKATPPVREASAPPVHRLSLGKEISNPALHYASIGLSLRELISPALQINLLPVEMRKKVRQIGKPLFIVLAMIALCLGLSWGIGVYRQVAKAWSGVNAEMKKRKPEIDAVEKLQKQKEALAKEAVEFAKIETAETSKVELLKEVTQILPPTVWIWNFKYNGKEIEISGFAESASDLIPLLDKSPLFERVEFMSPVTKERLRSMVGGTLVEKEKERFKIKMRMEAKKSPS